MAVSFTGENFTYSHSPRRNSPPHRQYSKPRPAVQPATKALVFCSLAFFDSVGTGENAVDTIDVVTLPKASVVVAVTSSRNTTFVPTERDTSMRPTASPPNM